MSQHPMSREHAMNTSALLQRPLFLRESNFLLADVANACQCDPTSNVPHEVQMGECAYASAILGKLRQQQMCNNTQYPIGQPYCCVDVTTSDAGGNVSHIKGKTMMGPRYATGSRPGTQSSTPNQLMSGSSLIASVGAQQRLEYMTRLGGPHAGTLFQPILMPTPTQRQTHSSYIMGAALEGLHMVDS